VAELRRRKGRPRSLLRCWARLWLGYGRTAVLSPRKKRCFTPGAPIVVCCGPAAERCRHRRHVGPRPSPWLGVNAGARQPVARLLLRDWA